MSSYLYPTYSRDPLSFVRGKGAWLFTEENEAYLDFSTGVAVNALGHSHPRVLSALMEQAKRVWHVSNLYTIPSQENLAKKLCAASFADRVFFTNSGSEAVELAIKTARRYHYARGAPQRNRLVTFEGAFHGRTLGALAATGAEKYLEGFGPALEGFDQVPLHDLDALRAAIGPSTAGILVEPIQGESGVRQVQLSELQQMRKLCDRNGLLLILDEVQTGIGRTGRFFAYEEHGIKPDILAAAKGLGAGFPVGACLATEHVVACMQPGSHGSTFGGNPLAMAVANAVVDIVSEANFLEHVRHVGQLFLSELERVVGTFPTVFEEVRGTGLLLGLKCRQAAGPVIAAFHGHRLLSVPARDNVIRLLPPLNVTPAEVREAVRRIEAAVVSMGEYA